MLQPQVPNLRRHEHMLISVEFFGIPRARAGVEKTTASGDCLGDVLADLAASFPDLAEACIEDRHLRAGYTANLCGERFVTDPNTPLSDGDTLLLLNLDAGG